MENKKGFTLIELIMVIVILGILAAVAIPRFFNLADDANDAAEQGVVGGVRSGIAAWHAQALLDPNEANEWPSSLDNLGSGSNCGAGGVPCFNVVLDQGGITTDDWSKTGANTYTGPNSGNYTYDSTDGSFE